MAQKFYNTETAAEKLGVSPGELSQMRERQELHGYRDGSDWKFKTEDVDQLVQQRQPKEPESAEDLDIAPQEFDAVDSSSSDAEDIDLTLDHDLTLADSGSDLELSSDSGLSLVEPVDDSVLGDSESDIIIGGDSSGTSSIASVDPSDSGISLEEEPVELVGDEAESLELGEDDMISLGEDADPESPTELKSDSDFLLTPMEDSIDEESSESGSQVIALEPEDSVVEAAEAAMPPMLDEDFGAEVGAEVAVVEPLEAVAVEAIPLGAQQEVAAGQPAIPATAAMPEAPYSALSVLSLAACVFLLTLTGWMMVDLLRNMWSWNGEYALNSWLMDTVLGLFG